MSAITTEEFQKMVEKYNSQENNLITLAQYVFNGMNIRNLQGVIPEGTLITKDGQWGNYFFLPEASQLGSQQN